MNENNNALKHLTISLTVLAGLFTVLFLLLPWMQDVLKNPHQYLNIGLAPTDFQMFVALGSVVLVIVLISFIVYLLLSTNTRANLIARGESEGLADSREQFIKLYEEAPVPYVMLDQTGAMNQPNKATLRFFGAGAQEIEGKNIFSLCAEEDSEIRDRLFQFYHTKVPINREEVRMTVKSGEVRWIMISIFTLGKSSNSNNVGLATIFDISEQKKLDQAKTEFVSLASHQLRSPMAAIKWSGDMLLSGDIGQLTDKQREYVNRIYKVNEETIDLVNTLLNVSRIEIGTLAIDKRATNVPEICQSILEELAPQIEQKKIQIEKQYNAPLENVNTDPKLLRIVIQNLISNAVKYTPDGGAVTIALNETANERQVSVTDTGYGIPKEQQDKIFTKLFRADNVRKLSAVQGTGLGLYLVKSIIEALGGNISFQSEENRGSIFTIGF